MPAARSRRGLIASAASVLGAVALAAPACRFGHRCGRSARPSAPAWVLEWSDEFDGSGGLDRFAWIYDLGTSYPGGPPRWGTGEVEVMTDSPQNVFRHDGLLHIRALHTGTDPIEGWTSGRVETSRTDFRPPSGGLLAVEARIQLPDLTGAAAQGYWPAFWMLGAPFRGDYYNWPRVGEIDIMENINGRDQWWGALHCGISPGGPCNEPSGLVGTASGFAPPLRSAFHVYRMELDTSVRPQQIRWYVDGELRHVVDQLGAPVAHPPHLAPPLASCATSSINWAHRPGRTRPTTASSSSSTWRSAASGRAIRPPPPPPAGRCSSTTCASTRPSRHGDGGQLTIRAAYEWMSPPRSAAGE